MELEFLPKLNVAHPGPNNNEDYLAPLIMTPLPDKH